MKRVTFILIMALAFGQQLSAKTIFVKAGATGNGTSWSDAIGDLHKALTMAQYGDAIWVATGEYFTTAGTDRSLYFQIPDGVELYGGFAGYEASVQDRNISNNPTKLSGEIGAPTADDNAYTVVFTENVSAETVVDGFIITGGSANEESLDDTTDPESCGAGWYNVATAGVSSPTIRNCQFIDNNAREGAGLFNYAYASAEVSPQITACTFIRNTSRLDGGAIYNGTEGGKSVPRIMKCRFEYNVATYGAGVMNKANGGKVTSMVKNCKFIANRAHFRGSGIYSDYSNSGQSKSIMAGCIFDKNISSLGDTVSSRSGSFDGGNNGAGNFNNSGL